MKFLTKTQFAKMIDISERTADRWHARRIGPARMKVGHFVAYRIDAVEQWMLENEISPVTTGVSHD